MLKRGLRLRTTILINIALVMFISMLLISFVVLTIARKTLYGPGIRTGQIMPADMKKSLVMFQNVVVLFSAGTTIVFVFIGSMLLGRYVVKPIETLVGTAEEITAGYVPQGLKPTGRNEIGTLAASLAGMSEKLREYKQSVEHYIESLKESNLQLRQVQGELIRSEKLSSVGRLAAGVAHEIGGVSGMKSALALANMGVKSFLIEKEKTLGGRLKHLYSMFPSDTKSDDIINSLIKEVKKNKLINVMTEAELVDIDGFIGNYKGTIKQKGKKKKIEFGTIVVATGFKEVNLKDQYQYGIISNILSQTEFEENIKNMNELNQINNKLNKISSYLPFNDSEEKNDNNQINEINNKLDLLGPEARIRIRGFRKKPKFKAREYPPSEAYSLYAAASAGRSVTPKLGFLRSHPS